MARVLSFNGAAFPDENVNPRIKRGKEWRLEYARAAYYSYHSRAVSINSQEGLYIGRASANQYDLIRAYAFGKQPSSIYKKALAPGNKVENLQLQVDWRVLHVLPHYRRTAIGRIANSQNYDVTINPIDSLARNEVADKINEIKGKILLRKALERQGLPELTNALPLQPEPEEPEDLDGLEVMTLGYRHKAAMEAEQIVDLIFTQNKYTELRKSYLEDLFDFGVASLQIYTEGCYVKIKNVDMRNLIMNYCHNKDFSDLKYIGEVKRIPVSKLESLHSDLDKNTLAKLYEQSRRFSWGLQGCSPFSNQYTFDEWFANGSVEVLDLEIKSIDTLAFEERINKRGNKIFRRSKLKNKQGISTRKVENIYKVNWIVGTDVVFGEPVAAPIQRKKSNLSCASFSYKLAVSEVHNMVTYSRTESVMPFVDEVQRAWYKLQHALNTAIPKGGAIDLDALESVSLTHGGEKLSIKEILNLYIQKGILLYRGRKISGNIGNQWFKELSGGVGQDIAEFSNVISMNIELIRSTLGLNDATDASTPNPKLLNKVAEMASYGTNNALSDIYDADSKLTQDSAEAAIIRSQYLIEEGKGEAFINALGIGTATLLKEVPPLDRYVFGTSIEQRPNAKEVEALEIALGTALESKQITIDDYLRVKSIRNIKQATLYLSYRVRKNAELQQRISQENIRENAAAGLEAAQQAEQEKRITLEHEYQLKNQYSEAQFQRQRKLLLIKGNFDLESERIASSGRVESSFVQARERQDSNVRNNITKLIDKGKEEKADVLNIKEELKSTVAPSTTTDDPIFEDVLDLDM